MKKAIYILISLIFFLYMPASGEELSEPWWRISESISGDFSLQLEKMEALRLLEIINMDNVM